MGGSQAAGSQLSAVASLLSAPDSENGGHIYGLLNLNIAFFAAVHIEIYAAFLLRTQYTAIVVKSLMRCLPTLLPALA